MPPTARGQRPNRRHIQEHSLGEAARIGRLSRIREFVLGAQDGLLVPLGVVTGMAAAHPARSLIIVAGLAEAVAGAISMGGGSYLASQAEEQLYASEIAAEGREIDEFPERETAELAIVLEREGLPASKPRRLRSGSRRTRTSSSAPRSRKNSDCPPTQAAPPSATRSWSAPPTSPRDRATLAVLLLLPQRRARDQPRLHAARALLRRSRKGPVTRLSLLRSGLQVMIVGSLSAGVGFAIGHLVTALSG